jgi:KDO2-lipid IV(A) lauroyltransferase
VQANVKPVSRWKQFRYRIEAGLLSALTRLLPLFSRGTVVAIGRALGWAGYHLLRRDRVVALANLDVAFGDTKSAAVKRRIARASFQNFAATMLGLFWARRLDRPLIEQLVEVDSESLQRVRELQARGKGVIFLALHYGDWELLSLATGYFGIPVTVVMELMRNRGIEQILARLRGRSGHRVISLQQAAPKLLRALKRGECVALLIDLNAGRRGGVWLKFFGLPVFNNSAMAALSLHTGAALVFGVAHPLPGGRVRIEYRPEIEFTPSGDYGADLHALSQRCLDVCEQLVRRRPELWLWSYKRWKYCPTTDRAGYPFYATYGRI